MKCNSFSETEQEPKLSVTQSRKSRKLAKLENQGNIRFSNRDILLASMLQWKSCRTCNISINYLFFEEGFYCFIKNIFLLICQ